VGDIRRRPRLLAFPGANPQAELALAELHFLGVGVGPAEGAVSGPEGCVVLGLPGFRWRPDGGGGVGVPGQFPVGGDDPGFVFPGPTALRVGGDWAEGLQSPPLWLLDGLSAEFGAARVGGVGQGGDEPLLVGVISGGGAVGVGVADRVQGQAAVAGDAVVEDVAELPCAGEVARGDRVLQDLRGVVSGQLGAAQNLGQGRGAVLGGDPLATISIRSSNSRRRVPIQRSAIAFTRGARTGVRKIRMPLLVKTVSKTLVNLLSRSRITSVKLATRSPRSIRKLRACWATQKKSVARMPHAWAARNCRQVGPSRRGVDAGSLEDRPHRVGRYRVAKPSKFAVDAPVTPSEVLCGQPQDQPAQFGRRATACGATARLGPALLDQVPVPSHDRGGGDDPRQLAGPGPQPSQCREHRPIRPRQPRPANLATQHRDLMT
jgi:hypothetical protein